VKPDPLSSVLLVEDNPAYSRLLKIQLEELIEGLEVHCADTLEGALNELSTHSVDAVLLDLALPDVDGMEGLEKVRMAAPDVPIVVLSGDDDLDVALKAMRNGAQEYLVKGQAERELLPRALRYTCERKRMQEFESYYWAWSVMT